MTDQLSGGVVQPTDAMELWAVHIQGPDDMIAMPSKAAAEKYARDFNEWERNRTDRHEYDPHVAAVAMKWTYSRASHTAALAVPQAPLQAEPVPVVASEPLAWWRKPADEIEAQAARSGSQEAMACYTQMRGLLQAVATPQAEPAVAEQARELVPMCQRIMDLVDEYHEHPHRNTRYAIRAALIDAWAPAALASQSTPKHPPRVTEGMVQHAEAMTAEAIDGIARLNKLSADLDAATSQSTLPPESAGPDQFDVAAVMNQLSASPLCMAAFKRILEANRKASPPESAGRPLTEEQIKNEYANYLAQDERRMTGPSAFRSIVRHIESVRGLAANPTAQPDGGSKA